MKLWMKRAIGAAALGGGLLAFSAGAASAQDVAADVSARLGRSTSAEVRVCADGQVSSPHCSPVLGHVPHRGFTVSFDDGGSMPSLIAATDSHAEVNEAEGVAEPATFTPVSTTRLRVLLQSGTQSVGLLEVKAFG